MGSFVSTTYGIVLCIPLLSSFPAFLFSAFERQLKMACEILGTKGLSVRPCLFIRVVGMIPCKASEGK